MTEYLHWAVSSAVRLLKYITRGILGVAVVVMAIIFFAFLFAQTIIVAAMGLVYTAAERLLRLYMGLRPVSSEKQ